MLSGAPRGGVPKYLGTTDRVRSIVPNARKRSQSNSGSDQGKAGDKNQEVSEKLTQEYGQTNKR